MSVKALHDAFVAAMKRELPDWKYVSSDRQFVKSFAKINWFAHMTFINHASDFDAVLDVAVEFVRDGERACVIGAGLGDIEGVGQVRYGVASQAEATAAAADAVAHLRRAGIPFLERYSEASAVLSTLEAGGSEARLISPFEDLQEQQIAALERIANAV